MFGVAENIRRSTAEEVPFRVVADIGRRRTVCQDSIVSSRYLHS